MYTLVDVMVVVAVCTVVIIVALATVRRTAATLAQKAIAEAITALEAEAKAEAAKKQSATCTEVNNVALQFATQLKQVK